MYTTAIWPLSEPNAILVWTIYVTCGHWEPSWLMSSSLSVWDYCSGYSLHPWPWAIWPDRGGAACLPAWPLIRGEGGSSTLLGGEDRLGIMKQCVIGFPRTLQLDYPPFRILINPWYPLNRDAWISHYRAMKTKSLWKSFHKCQEHCFLKKKKEPGWGRKMRLWIKGQPGL